MNKALEYAKQIAYSTEETLMFTYEMAKKYDNSPGCYVECGVAAGAQIIAMRAAAITKDIYAIDSFQGLPLPSNRDNQMPGIKLLTKDEQKLLPAPGNQKLISTGAVSVSVDDFWRHILQSGVPTRNINVVEGWFENIIPKFAELREPIAILRLDGDLYNSTWVCLEHLYPNVVGGGLVIIDDWELPGCRSAVQEFLFEQNKELDIPMPDIEFVSNIAYWVKP